MDLLIGLGLAILFIIACILVEGFAGIIEATIRRIAQKRQRRAYIEAILRAESNRFHEEY